ncbi:MAG: hypothetical protein K8I60_15620 [Anaerolineae bacterium]|nr:hypothetical protein [Anaerolineae bacterium]
MMKQSARRHRWISGIVAGFSALVLLSACTVETFLSGIAAGMASPEIATPSPTAQYTQCGWSWATHPLPDLTEQVQAAITDAGLIQVTIRVVAFGEDCIPQNANTTGYFATMETDFDVQITVASLDDEVAIGEQVRAVLDVLSAFPPDATPGPQPGYVSIHAVSGNGEQYWRFSVTQAEAARAAGLTGAALLAKLTE